MYPKLSPFIGYRCCPLGKLSHMGLEQLKSCVYPSLERHHYTIHMSLVCQQSSVSSPNSPRDNKCLNINHINSKSNELLSPVIPLLPSCNDPFINPTQLSSVRQQSSSSSPNTTHELQVSSIPGRTSPDPSNTMPPPSTNNGTRNIYGCMVDVSKLTPAQ